MLYTLKRWILILLLMTAMSTSTMTASENDHNLTDVQLHAVLGIITNFILSSQSPKEIALNKIATYAQNGETPPLVEDYEDAGVVGVTALNVSALNVVVVGLSSDAVDSTEELQAIVDAMDVLAPLITLNGDANISILLYEVYVEQNATALDETDGNVTDDIVIDNALVDTSVVGTYTVTYTVSDASGNTAEANRTVNIIDSIEHSGTTYGFVISPHTGKIWLDRNLGAARVCTDLNDSACYGDYYQWGRNADGHQDSTSDTNTTQATDVDNVGHGDFITINGDWASVDSNGSSRSANWSKTDGSSVCPVGFRVPNISELEADTLNNGITDIDTAFESFLKLPSAGRRHFDGSLEELNSDIYVWSNEFNINRLNYANYIHFSTGAGVDRDRYTYGFSVRCIKDTVNTLALPVVEKRVHSLNGVCKVYADQSGEDLNFNGVLDDDEITSTTAETFTHGTPLTKAELKTKINAKEDVTSVNTCQITDMSNLFNRNYTFNQDISSWNTGAVNHMAKMFFTAIKFNKDISAWDVSSVSNMNQMFRAAIKFNQNISIWNVNNVTSHSLFASASPISGTAKVPNFPDITVPTLTLIGTDETIEAGSTYTDAGATADDDEDGNITANIVSTSTVDVSTVGTYTVTYDVNDSSSNAAIQVTRTVMVLDTTAPVITLNGDSTITLGLNETYDEENVSTSDNASTDLTFTLTGDVNTSTEGSYTLTYIVSDASGNESNVTRTVEVQRFIRDDTDEIVTDYLTGRMWQDDEDAATLTKNWQDAIDHCLAMDFGGYTDWVLPELDVLSSLIDSSTVFNIVDEFSNMGAHFYWSATSDEYNNDAAQGVNFTFSGIISGSLKTATKHFRCVRDIVDITAPVITLNGDTNISVILNQEYEEENATAQDEKDDNVTDDIVINNTLVDTSVVGTYTVTYTVSDIAGNTAEANRTVNVIDSIEHNGTTYGFVTSSYTGKVWLDRNLGASQVCTSTTDTDCYGNYYQWGRNADGHQSSTSNTNSTLVDDVNNLNNIGHGDFITSTTFADWASVDTDDAPIRSANWAKTDGSSVCPVGFRVPILAELESEIVGKGAKDFSTFLKLPFAGIRFFSDGSMLQENTTGIIWANSPTGRNSSGISFASSADGAVSALQRAFGTSVRCMKD